MEVKEPNIDSKSSFNFFTSIWIVPFIAAIIALWLVYEHFSKLGPQIKIEFKNSGGLVAGQSVVKFRDVPVGKVTQIKINPKREGVIVYAQLNKDVENFLNGTTKFWIVKPEVDYSGVRGLDTLLSGSYIAMYAKRGFEEKKDLYRGLEHPYIDINSGDYYVVESSFPVKVQPKTPVYFRGLKVGEIDNINLDTQSKNLIVIVRIYKEYSNLVNSSTKFWVQSLIDLKLTDNRLEVGIAPLPILLSGGIAFDTTFTKSYPKDFSKIFKLHRSLAEARVQSVGLGNKIIKPVVFKFHGDVSSLDPQSSIKYKGFQIGQLNSLKIYYNKNLKNFEAQCFGTIDFSNFSTKTENGFNNFKELAKSGLIAVMQKPNFLINKSVIVIKESNNTVHLVKDKKLNAYILPTQEFKDTSLLLNLDKIAKKIKALNLNKTVNELNNLLATAQSPLKKLTPLLESSNKTIKSIGKIVSRRDFQNIGSSVNKSLLTFQKTLQSLTRVLNEYSTNSLFGDKLESTLKELHDASQRTNQLLYKLNQKPNSLIFGD